MAARQLPAARGQYSAADIVQMAEEAGLQASNTRCHILCLAGATSFDVVSTVHDRPACQLPAAQRVCVTIEGQVQVLVAAPAFPGCRLHQQQLQTTCAGPAGQH